MLKNLIKIFLLSVCFIACKDKLKTQERDQAIVGLEEKCYGRLEKQEIVKTVLNVKNIRSYLHLEVEERNPIRILNEEFLLELNSFNFNSVVKVVFVDSIPKDDRNLTLRIDLDSCSSSSGTFFFFSPLENAEVNGIIKQKYSSWIVEVKSDIEF